MAKTHIEAVFEHTVFIRPEGEGFSSVKSKYIALDHVVIKSNNGLKLNQICDVEITLLDTVSGKPIKVKAEVADINGAEVKLNYIEISDISVKKLEELILHYTRQPLEFEAEINEYEAKHSKKHA